MVVLQYYFIGLRKGDMMVNERKQYERNEMNVSNSVYLKSQFEIAKAAITLEHYTEARKILQKINHPTATRWLTKLDEIDPPKQIHVVRKTVTGIITIVLLIFVVVWLHDFTSNSKMNDASTLIVRISTYKTFLLDNAQYDPTIDIDKVNGWNPTLETDPILAKCNAQTKFVDGPGNDDPTKSIRQLLAGRSINDIKVDPSDIHFWTCMFEQNDYPKQ